VALNNNVDVISRVMS